MWFYCCRCPLQNVRGKQKLKKKNHFGMKLLFTVLCEKVQSHLQFHEMVDNFYCAISY